MAREITPERRQALREQIHRTRPWLLSTGPRTAAGKARSRMNALRHGRFTAKARAVRSAVYWALRLLARDGRELAARGRKTN